MLEDDQRFEELESKLAALSSQVEGLELDTELNPFSEDDVRRTVEYFKNLELEGLESEDFGGEDFDDADESSSSEDFISVQTTGGPSFKAHWISPDSCENMTLELARAAFIQGAADRYGTSLQINNGDVLILLCREAVEEEPEEGSEPEPEDPKELCRYVGLAYNTLINPSSAEPSLETEESISDTIGNYEILVWSSCNCSEHSTTPVYVSDISEVSLGADVSNYVLSGTGSSGTGGNGPAFTGLLNGSVVKNDELITGLVSGGAQAISSTSTSWTLKQLRDLSASKKEIQVNACGVSESSESGNFNLFGPADSGGSTLSMSGLSGGEKVSIAADESLFIPITSKAATIKKADSFCVLPANPATPLPTLGEGEENEDLGIASGSAISDFEYQIGLEAIETSSGLSYPGNATPNLTLVLPHINGNAKSAGPLNILDTYDVTIEAVYSKVDRSEGVGDAKYFFYKKAKSLEGVEWDSGLLTAEGASVEDTAKVLLGVIKVAGIPLTYGCHPEYGCVLDPAGQYTDPQCGSGCDADCYAILEYRPSYIYLYFYNTAASCYVFKGEYSINSANESNDVATQYYSQVVMESANDTPAATDQGRFTAVCASDSSSSEITTKFEFTDRELGDAFVIASEPEYKITTSPLAPDEMCNSDLEEALAEIASMSFSGSAIKVEKEIDFSPTENPAELHIYFGPKAVEDGIHVQYEAGGALTTLINYPELSTTNIPPDYFDELISFQNHANSGDGSFPDGSRAPGIAGPSDLFYYFEKTIPAGSTKLKVAIDGLVSGDPNTEWDFGIALQQAH